MFVPDSTFTKHQIKSYTVIIRIFLHTNIGLDAFKHFPNLQTGNYKRIEQVHILISVHEKQTNPHTEYTLHTYHLP